MANLPPIDKFKFFSNMALPLVYDETLSYYETLQKVVYKLNEIVNLANTQNQAIEDFETQITDFVETWTNNIRTELETWKNNTEEDIDTWLNNALDAITEWENQFETEYEELKDEVEQIAQDAETAKNAAESAAADAAESAEQAAESAATLIVDATLSIPGRAADAKATGDAIEELNNEKANIDGTYNAMTVGSAKQLLSTDYVEEEEPYIFRTSGGSADIGNRETDIIVGGTVAWNQIAPETTKTASREFDADTATYNIVLYTNLNIPLVYGHKMIASAKIERVMSGNNGISINFRDNNTSVVSINVENGEQNGYVYQMFEIPYNQNIIQQIVLNNYLYKRGYNAGDSIAYDNLMIIDLTQMLGTEIANYIYSLEQTTTGDGIAWFRHYFPNDYYEYNSGELLSVKGLQSHDMVGFNQWDEVWELGGYNSTTGLPTVSTTTIRSKNRVQVMPETSYCFSRPVNNGAFNILWYDDDDKFITVNTVGAGTEMRVIKSPSNARYLRFYMGTGYGTTYKNDICINLSWSGYRNGEYEPYEKYSYPLDDSLVLRGITKLDASGNLYYDGDTYESNGTVTRRYGVVDLGTLNWTSFISGEGKYFASFSNVMKATNNIFCEKYVTVATSTDSSFFDNSANDKCINTYIGSNGLRIYDSAYSTTASFKAAVSGVMLVYELATPTTETAEPYQNPQWVDDFGTEEYVTSSIIPVGHKTKYSQNLRDKLQHLPFLAESNGYYIIEQIDTNMSLMPIDINKLLPETPEENGTYQLITVVNDGNIELKWQLLLP